MILNEFQRELLNDAGSVSDTLRERLSRIRDFERKIAAVRGEVDEAEAALNKVLHHCSVQGVPWEQLVRATGYSKNKVKRRAVLGSVTRGLFDDQS